jgi:hypothetical protein
MNFWFPVKRLAMQMIFLLPLFVVFYAWNNTSIRKGRGIQILVSSHLLVVSFIPIFFKIIETVLRHHTEEIAEKADRAAGVTQTRSNLAIPHHCPRYWGRTVPDLCLSEKAFLAREAD